jgi:hypothetical protein
MGPSTVEAITVPFSVPWRLLELWDLVDKRSFSCWCRRKFSAGLMSGNEAPASWPGSLPAPTSPHFATNGRFPVVNMAAQVPQVIHHGIRGWGMTTGVKNASPPARPEGHQQQEVMIQIAQEHFNSYAHPRNEDTTRVVRRTG